ncbi:MAG: terminase large subunit domain-containing protein, partial [Isosphaerales bacterium]
SKRRVQWPYGARAICLSGEEPERARGLNVDTLWADELACWQRAESTWDLAMLALRAGTNPQALITTTPRRVAVLRRILTEASTVQTTETTYANQAHLPPEFITQIVGLYENTRLGRQEIYAEFLETSEGVWFAIFDPARHVSVEAEYHPGYHVRCAIDAGTSRHTAAVFFQVRSNPAGDRPRVTVFADYLALDVFSQKNARAIEAMAGELPCRGRIDRVRLDPAATARSSLGPAAYGEYERIFGSRIVARWPFHPVLDGLDTIELLLDSGNLLIHPRCAKLKDAFRNYCRKRRRGEWIDEPADGHPEEDLIDALRGGIRDALPEVSVSASNLTSVHASRLF